MILILSDLPRNYSHDLCGIQSFYITIVKYLEILLYNDT